MGPDPAIDPDDDIDLMQEEDLFHENDDQGTLTPKRSSKVYQSKNSRTMDTVPPPSINLIRTKEYSNINRIADRDHLTDENWHEWKERIKRVFINCDITGYTTGAIRRPNEFLDFVGARNWDKNDTWAQQVIMHNVTSSQMNHVGTKSTAEEMYSALMVTHENKAHQTVNHIQNLLYETKLHDGDDLLKHLDTLKSHRDRMNKFPNTDFHVADTRFKAIISASLPLQWQTYVEPYNGNANDPNDPDPKRRLSSDAFIGLLREEYKIRLTRSNNGNSTNSTSTSVNLVKTQNANSASKSLEDRITDRKSSIRPYCEHCKCAGHWTSKCRKFDGNKCHNCGKFGHQAKNCWSKKKVKDKGNGNKKGAEKTNVGEEFITFEADEEPYNFDTYYACNADENDNRLIYYEWLADTATTSHVTHQRQAFVDYTPMENCSVTGVGGKEANIAGRGTVELNSICNGITYAIRLENVLHVPGTRNNLISLGRWDEAGGTYSGGNGEITLITTDGRPIAHGNKIQNHLYNMDITIRRTHPTTTTTTSHMTDHTFVGNDAPPTWETWHRRFGHVGYTGLQKLLDRKM